MGIVGSCVGSCLASCACEGVSRACGACKSDKRQPPSLIPYFCLLVLTTVLALVARFWGGPLLIHLKVIDFTLCDSDKCLGYAGVYRLMFSLALFFLGHALVLMLIRKCSRLDASSWLLRLVILVGLLVAAWFIPNSFYDPAYVNIARVFSAFFIIAQIVLFIDFAYTWNESWLEREWKAPILAVSLLFFIGSLLLLVFAFLKFNGDGSSSCHSEKFMISFTLILTLVASVISILPLATEHNRGGVLPASLLTLYSYYMLWSALNSDPSQCNTLSSSSDSAAVNVTHIVLGLLISCLSLTYAAYSVTKMDEDRSGSEESKSQQLAPTSTDSVRTAQYHDLEPGGDALATAGSDEEEEEAETAASSAMWQEVARRHSRFHLVMCVACLYLSMILTDWSSVTAASDESGGTGITQATWDSGVESMWIKVLSGWIAIFLYVWTLVVPVLAPRCFPDRDFD